MMQWFIELMELIDQWTRIGNYSYLAAGAIVILIVMIGVGILGRIFKNQ